MVQSLRCRCIPCGLRPLAVRPQHWVSGGILHVLLLAAWTLTAACASTPTRPPRAVRHVDRSVVATQPAVLATPKPTERCPLPKADEMTDQRLTWYANCKLSEYPETAPTEAEHARAAQRDAAPVVVVDDGDWW
jgi:hypothetical protein